MRDKKNKLELSAEDIIRILSEFDIRRVPYLHDGEAELYGLCIGDNKMIEISHNVVGVDRYSTIIHELIHAKDMLEKGSAKEKGMNARTNRAYKQIFGQEYEGAQSDETE
jgi:hypothetical protein